MALAAVALAAAVGAVAGYVLTGVATGGVTLHDNSGTLAVTVPRDWSGHTSTRAWRLPDSSTARPSLLASTAPGWAEEPSTAHGVFVALLPGEDLPTQLPAHPECAEAGDLVEQSVTGSGSLTTTFTDCPGGNVVLERVVEVDDDELLWVQVRADDRAEAVDVADTARAGS